MYTTSEEVMGMYFYMMASPAGASSLSIATIDCSDKSLNHNYIGKDNILCPIVAIQGSKQLSIVNE